MRCTLGAMLPAELLDLPSERICMEPGTVVLRRGVAFNCVSHIESGRVARGLMDGGVLAHQLGAAEGPFWLEASAALLGLASVVDAVAETRVTLRRLPMAAFRNWLGGLPKATRGVLRDVALAHRQQTELAVSRLAKDAEARCAEWLLRHAEVGPQGGLAVMLQQRKRMLAAQLGIAPETLSRVLRQLRERSLISVSGRVLSLVDPAGLRSLAGA